MFIGKTEMRVVRFSHIVFFIYISCILNACSPSVKQEQSNNVADTVIQNSNADSVAPGNIPASEMNVTFKVFKNETGETYGFGYDIYMNGKRYVHQPNIPAVSGNKGFSTEADAQKTAELVAYKVRHNMMPPSVTAQELDSIGVK